MKATLFAAALFLSTAVAHAGEAARPVTVRIHTFGPVTMVGKVTESKRLHSFAPSTIVGGTARSGRAEARAQLAAQAQGTAGASALGAGR